MYVAICVYLRGEKRRGEEKGCGGGERWGAKAEKRERVIGTGRDGNTFTEINRGRKRERQGESPPGRCIPSHSIYGQTQRCPCL